MCVYYILNLPFTLDAYLPAVVRVIVPLAPSGRSVRAHTSRVPEAAAAAAVGDKRIERGTEKSPESSVARPSPRKAVFQYKYHDNNASSYTTVAVETFSSAALLVCRPEAYHLVSDVVVHEFQRHRIRLWDLSCLSGRFNRLCEEGYMVERSV